ncbi:hypothetical protein LRP49_18265 [Enterovibrio sp. ZSDZ35]|uniref:Uncharacterized protein n=1 Tax=Enterovibrio qingdaonensis TaxID=2899818 RepID=A0ABT5QQ44_9GAMM|nr:hypothetical protein [Enterovibrio sp. ZSDZ35]MDD1783115.1 hypothetical protein [Enterovibrio sp. ZSDZ35]
MLTSNHGKSRTEGQTLLEFSLQEAEKEGLKLDKVYELTPKMLDVAGISGSKREEAIHLLADR